MNKLRYLIEKRLAEKQKINKARNNLLWLFLLSSFIFFTFLSILYTQIKAKNFQLTPIFYLSTFMVLVNSISIHVSYVYYKKDELEKGLLYLYFTLAICFMFLCLQLVGWSQLFVRYYEVLKSNLMLFIIISGFHFAHIVGGWLFLIYLVFAHHRYKIHAKSINGIKNATFYFHTLGIVWLILFILF